VAVSFQNRKDLSVCLVDDRIVIIITMKILFPHTLAFLGVVAILGFIIPAAQAQPMNVTDGDFEGMPNVNMTDDEFEDTDCSLWTDCVSCLEDGYCNWCGDGMCKSWEELNTTAPDIFCYFSDMLDESGNSSTAEEICSAIVLDDANMELCQTLTDCATCRATPLENKGFAHSAETCQWYEERGTCSSLLYDEQGGSSNFCRESPEGICFYGGTNCTTCLEISDGNCTWINGECSLDCYTRPDEEFCFSTARYPEQNVTEICTSYDAFMADFELCASFDFLSETPENCNTCTAKIKSNGIPCAWVGTGEDAYCSSGLVSDGGVFTVTCDADDEMMPPPGLVGIPTVGPSDGVGDDMASVAPNDEGIEPFASTAPSDETASETTTAPGGDEEAATGEGAGDEETTDPAGSTETATNGDVEPDAEATTGGDEDGEALSGADGTAGGDREIPAATSAGTVRSAMIPGIMASALLLAALQ
jgi:hypothetical protein